MKPKVIVIAGPTASGKTKVSIELAKKIDGQIVGADSMQIYKDMDIGTAKPTKEETEGIRHYLIDIISPEERFNVAEYKKRAIDAIKEILENGKTPIVVGGTGLYIDSLIYGIEYPQIEFNEGYRKELERIARYDLLSLYNIAKRIDPEAVEKISKNDKKRIIRILEIYKSTGKTKTEQERLSRQNKAIYDYKVFTLNMPREILYERINKRVDIMIDQGLIEEVGNILKKYKKFPTAMQGLGYKEVVEYINEEMTKEEMIEKVKIQTRRYAKRQLTWFKKNKEAHWIDIPQKLDINEIIEKIIKIHLEE